MTTSKEALKTITRQTLEDIVTLVKHGISEDKFRTQLQHVVWHVGINHAATSNDAPNGKLESNLYATNGYMAAKVTISDISLKVKESSKTSHQDTNEEFKPKEGALLLIKEENSALIEFALKNNKHQTLFFVEEMGSVVSLVLLSSNESQTQKYVIGNYSSDMNDFPSIATLNEFFKVNGATDDKGNLVIESNIAPMFALNHEYIARAAKILIGKKARSKGMSFQMLDKSKILVKALNNEGYHTKACVICTMRM